MLIIPAIEIYEGKCVALNKGNFDNRVVFPQSPADLAKSFSNEGFSYLHVVDLEGAQRGQVKNWQAIESILAVPGVKAEVGGGVRSKDEIQRLLEVGAKRVILGSIAVTLPGLVKKWIYEIGASRIALAVDVRNGKISHSGWLEEAEQSPTMFMLEMKNGGVSSYICTDINSENLFQGPNIELYRELRPFFPDVELVASGGITCLDDVEKLNGVKLSGVIVGRALLENRIQARELMRFVG